MHTKLTERFLNYKLSFFSKTLRIENKYFKPYCKKVTDFLRYLSACPKKFF